MNCKPGDLAAIVSSHGHGRAAEISKMLVGRIVRVTHLGEPPRGLPCAAAQVWFFEEPIKLWFDGASYMAHGIADDCLRPIRDPGDDAQDETLQWLPVPSVQKEAA